MQQLDFNNHNKNKHIDLLIEVGLFFSVISFLMLALSKGVADPDLWGYLSFGRLFWHSNKFPYQDVFAYVPTLNPWVYHEWLTGVLFYPLYQILGGPGLQILKYCLILATMGLVYLTARRRGAHPVVVGLFSAFNRRFWEPQMFNRMLHACLNSRLKQIPFSGKRKGISLA